MEKLIASQNKLWLIFLFDLFLIVRAQMEDENAMKVFSCINIVTSKNFKTGEMEPSYYSPIVLTCFFKIKKEQVQKILSSLGEEEDPLDPDELKELTNVDGLKDYSEEEVKKKQAELDSIVREFQRIDEEYEMREKEKYMSKFESENEDENYIDSDDNYELGQDQDSDFVLHIENCILNTNIQAAYESKLQMRSKPVVTSNRIGSMKPIT